MNDVSNSGAPAMRENIKNNRPSISPMLVLSAAVFGVVFSYLFAKQSLGLNVLIFVLAVYGFAVYNRKLFVKKTFAQDRIVYLFCAPVLFLAASFFFQNSVLAPLTVMVILFVLLGQFMDVSGHAVNAWHQMGFLLDMLLGFFNRVIYPIGSFCIGTVNCIFKKQSDKKKSAVFGILIGLGLLIIIVPLLTLADASVSEMLADFFANIYLGDILLYLILFLVGASLVTAPVMSAHYEKYTGKRQARTTPDKRPIEGVTVGVALSMIGVVYILFAMVQFGYFFAPQQTVASQLGLTSSAYAVRGFGELVFITCLNFIIIAVAMRFTKQKEGKTPVFLQVLYTLLIVFNFVIMASSHLRMQLYEMHYGYTVARFLSHSFMVLLAILNAIMLVRIYRNIKGGKLFIIATMLYYCIVVALNPQLFVTRQNIARYEREQTIDAAYMFTLSGDALSEAVDFVSEHAETFDDAAKKQAQRKQRSYSYRNDRGWQSLNIADEVAYFKLNCLLE